MSKNKRLRYPREERIRLYADHLLEIQRAAAARARAPSVVGSCMRACNSGFGARKG